MVIGLHNLCAFLLGVGGGVVEESGIPSWNPSLLDARPNILWLTVEDMSPWLSCYGDATVATPHLDQLAARSVRYTHAYSNAPVCAPARATLITGCYATSIGAQNMRTGKPSRAELARDPHAYDGIPSYEATPPPQVRCFPELLRAQGYFCSNNSKRDYQFREPVTVWDVSGRKAHWRNRPDADQPFFAVFNYGGTHESGTFPGTPRKPRVTDPAKVPLPPYYPDTPIVRQDIARTYDNIAAMDAWVGRILQQLEDDGLADNTIVFFFSDHGVGLPRGKRCLYDSGTRVPFLLADPQGRTGVEDRLVSFVDFAPTVLSLTGHLPPSWMMGRAFAGSHAVPPAPHVFLHADRMDAKVDRTRGITDGRFRYLRNFMPDRPRIYPVAYADSIPMTAEIRALAASGKAQPAQWQMVQATKPEEELYDTVKDPHEIHNLAGEPVFASIQQSLSAALEQWSLENGDLGELSEMDLVKTRLWSADGKQPTTAEPRVRVNIQGDASLASATFGASLGWRVAGERVWQVASNPLPWEVGAEYQLIAHRIGFQPSAMRKLVYSGISCPEIVEVLGSIDWKIGALDVTTVLETRDGVGAFSMVVRNATGADLWWPSLTVRGSSVFGSTRSGGGWGANSSSIACGRSSFQPERNDLFYFAAGTSRSFEGKLQVSSSSFLGPVSSWAMRGTTALPSTKPCEDWPEVSLKFIMGWSKSRGPYVTSDAKP